MAVGKVALEQSNFSPKTPIFQAAPYKGKSVGHVNN